MIRRKMDASVFSGKSWMKKLLQTKNYSVGNVNGASYYQWTVTGGAIILSGQGTTNIAVSFATAVSPSVTISVIVSNACGSSAASVKNVSVNFGCKTADPDLTSSPGFSAEAFIVYPNPSSGKFTIDYDANENCDVIITVIDLLGKDIIKKESVFTKGSNKKELDLTKMNPGIYLLQLSIKGESPHIIRIVKE